MMMKRGWFGLLFGLVLLLSVSLVSANHVCRQDLPNETIGDCGFSNGTINWTNVMQGGAGKVIFNYAKPVSVGNGSLWQVEHGFNDATGLPYLYNVSIPQVCLDASDSVVQLRMWSWYQGFANNVRSGLECYNGSGWESFGTLSSFNGTYALGGYTDRTEPPVKVWDKLYYDDYVGSYAYFCVETPTIYWMTHTFAFANNKYAYLYEQTMFWEIICDENWVSNYTVCRNGVHTKYYVDENVCGTFAYLPVDNGTVSTCLESGGGGGGSGYIPPVVVKNETNVSVAQDEVLVGADTSFLARIWNGLVDFIIFWE